MKKLCYYLLGVVHSYYFHTREMPFHTRAMLSSIIFVLVSLCFFLLVHGDGVITSIDYAEALNKSLLYYEAQRSGELPIHQRVEWRAYSALSDGKEAGVR